VINGAAAACPADLRDTYRHAHITMTLPAQHYDDITRSPIIDKRACKNTNWQARTYHTMALHEILIQNTDKRRYTNLCD